MREIRRPLVTKIRWAASDPWLVQYPTASDRIGTVRFGDWEQAFHFAVSMAVLYLPAGVGDSSV